MDDLTRGRQSPVGQDILTRTIRVHRRMRMLATGAEGGPGVRSGNLLANISFIVNDGPQGLEAEIGVFSQRMVRRNWNYAYILEGPNSVNDPRIQLNPGHEFGEGARRPFMARALLAAAN